MIGAYEPDNPPVVFECQPCEWGQLSRRLDSAGDDFLIERVTSLDAVRDNLICKECDLVLLDELVKDGRPVHYQ